MVISLGSLAVLPLLRYMGVAFFSLLPSSCHLRPVPGWLWAKYTPDYRPSFFVMALVILVRSVYTAIAKFWQILTQILLRQGHGAESECKSMGV